MNTLRASGASLLVLLVAAGCGSARPSLCLGQSDDDCRVDSMVVGEVTRTFVVSHRGQLDCTHGRVQVVLAWHGEGDSGEGLRRYLGLEEALDHGALVVYPDALARPETDGDSGWNLDPKGDDIAFFDALVSQLAADRCLETRRLFSVGHSRGGQFVEVLACFRGERHLAVASIASGTGGVTTCSQRAAVWLTHSENDQIVPFSEGEQHRENWARRNSCNEPWTFPADKCTELSHCLPSWPVVWCPSTVSDVDGHAPPPFAPAAIKRFFARFK